MDLKAKRRGGRAHVRILVVLATLLTAVATLSGEPPVASAGQYGRYCSSGYPIRSVSTSRRVVAFTFDDGPSPYNTAQVMSTMERYGWRASFFVVGVNVNYYPSIARSIVARGHTIANHSMTHTYSWSGIANEIPTASSLISSVTGIRPTFFRAPGLTLSSTVNAAAYANGMCNISTASDLGDWRSPRVSASTLCYRYKQALRPGAIILLHDGGGRRPTTDALPCMLDYTRQQGYSVVHLGDLLAGTYPATPTPPPPTTPTTPPTLPTTCPTSAYGSRGTAVALAQRAVMNSGIYLRGGADGIFGVYTRAAVQLYQSRKGLPATGAVDVTTAQVMGLCAPSSTPTTPSVPVWTPVAINARGTTVVAIQRAIINSGIYLVGGADGWFGRYTEAAVRTYQSARGLAVTGVVDEATAIKMGLFTPPPPPTTTTTTTTTTSTTTTVPPTTTTTTTTTSTTSTTTSTTSTSTTIGAMTTAAPQPVGLGDRVWLDADDDGLQDPTELGVPDVEVRLLNAAETPIATTRTDVLGAYRFPGVIAGTYVVEFVLPVDHAFAKADVPPDDELDSDTHDVVVREVEDETVARVPVTFNGLADDLSIDAGLVAAPAATLSVQIATAQAAPPTADQNLTVEEPATSAAPATVASTAAPATTAAPTTQPPATAAPATEPPATAAPTVAPTPSPTSETSSP